MPCSPDAELLQGTSQPCGAPLADGWPRLGLWTANTKFDGFQDADRNARGCACFTKQFMASDASEIETAQRAFLLSAKTLIFAKMLSEQSDASDRNCPAALGARARQCACAGRSKIERKCSAPRPAHAGRPRTHALALSISQRIQNADSVASLLISALKCTSQRIPRLAHALSVR